MKAHGIHLWGGHRWSLWFLLIDAYTPTRQRHVQRAQVRTLGPDFILEISKILWKFQNEYIFVPTLFSRGAGSGHRWGQPGIEWWCGFSLILQCYQLSCMTMVRMRQLTGLSLSSVGTTSCVATGGGALWTGPMSAMRSWCWWWGACLTWTPSGGRVGTHRIETVLVQTLSWDRIY